jgi:hypothetical protein
MNQRIKELAIQAGRVWRGGYVEQANGDSVYTDKKFVSGGDMDVEQFARLLVKECMEQVWYTREDGINGNVSQVIKDRFKEHFGVEE